MRYLYTFVVMLLTPWFILRLWWKGRHAPAYRDRIAERFGFNVIPDKQVDLWVHAVSLGEVIALAPLLEGLIKKSYRIVLTTMTPTGSAHVQKCYGNTVLHQYLPYDLPWALKRFLKHYQPKVLIIMETELWPNLIWTAKAAQVPVLLINGRLSQQSYQGYCWLRWLFKPVLNAMSGILVQTDADAQRFIKLGANTSCVRVLGNMKFDLNLEVPPVHALQILKNQWGSSRSVLMLASTHENEEQQILAYLPLLQTQIPNILILIAPRHQDRFEKVTRLCENLGYITGRRSLPTSITPDVQIVVLDTFGELMLAYACSDYGFVGGSLVPVGGHNILEPIAVGIPVYSGPYTHNFTAICAALSEANALQIVLTPLALIEAVIYHHQHPEERSAQVERASQLLAKNRGVVGQYIKEIEIYSPKVKV